MARHPSDTFEHPHERRPHTKFQMSDTPTMEDVVPLISQVFSLDPNEAQPVLCGSSLTMALGYIHVYNTPSEDMASVYLDLRKRHPDFVNTLFTFMFSVNVDSLQEFQERMAPCHCNVNDILIKRLHPPRLMEKEKFMKRLCDTLFMFPVCFALISSGSLYRARERSFEQKSDKALQTFTHYMLNDAAQTVDASCSWFEVTKDLKIPGFLSQLAKQFRPTFDPPLRSKQGQRFLTSLLAELQEIVLGFQKVGAATEDALYDVICCCNFITSLSTYPTEFFGENARSMYDTSTAFRHVFRFHCEHPQFPGGEPPTDVLLATSMKMTAVFNLAARCILNMEPDEYPVAVSDSDVEQPPSPKRGENTYKVACTVLAKCQRIKNCLNPGCGKPPETHRFKKCSQCGIASYCSRECQIQAWSLAKCPHKAVCKDWGSLAKIWPLDATPNGIFPSLRSREHELKNDKLKGLVAPLGLSEEYIASIAESSRDLIMMRQEYMLKPVSDMTSLISAMKYLQSLERPAAESWW